MKIKYILAKALKVILNPPAKNNCHIGSSSWVGPRSELTNCTIGRYTYVGQGNFIVNTNIGSFCSIADKCSIGGAIHPVHRISTSPVFHNGKNVLKKNFENFPEISTPTTIIENDVWIAMGVFIKAGVIVHNGAVIGMGSVVTKDVPAYEVWAGNPAKKISDRFEQEEKSQIEKSAWWNLSDEELKSISPFFNDVRKFIEEVQKLK